MNLLVTTFRYWWKKPRKISEIEESREVSFLELFYDLIFVWIFAQLTHALVAHVGVIELLGFMGVFAMVWFAWINGSFYHEMHGNNDIRTRVFTFAQMFALIGIAIFAHNAIGDGANGFTISYILFLIIITFLWWRTGVHDPSHRPMSTPYVVTFLIMIGVFIASLFFGGALKYMLWAAAIGILLVLPVVIPMLLGTVDSEHLENVQRLRPSIIERFGLFTIILVGEVLNSIVSGGAEQIAITFPIFLAIAFAFVIGVSIWWVYFDFVARRSPRQQTGTRFVWMYLHLFITMSIALTSAGLLNVLTHMEKFGDFDRWLIVGPVSLFLISLVLIIKTIIVRSENHEVHDTAGHTALFSAVVIFLIGFSSFGVLVTLGLTALLMLVPVLAVFRLWVHRAYNASLQEQGG